MFHFKNSFLKVFLLSVAFFSFTSAVDDVGVYEQTLRCKTNMENIFGYKANSITSMQIAIKFLKLYGEHKFNYSEDVATYYMMFHFYINPEPILLRRDYCNKITRNFNLSNVEDKEVKEEVCERNYQKCIDQLLIFEEKIDNEDIFPGTSNVNDSYLNTDEINTNFQGVSYVSANDSHTDTGASSVLDSNKDTGTSKYVLDSNTDEGTSYEHDINTDADLKYNIIRNALYYHKQGDPPPGVVLTDETNKYFHVFESYGYFYLDHIAEVIELINGNALSPKEYCIKKYNYNSGKRKRAE